MFLQYLRCLMKYTLHIPKQITDLGWIEMNLMSFHHINLVEMRKRTPKMAPFLAIIVLLTIPFYYPSIIDSSKKLNTTFESSIESLKDTNNPCSSLEGGGADALRCKENEPDATAQHHDAAAGENRGKEIREEVQPVETEPAIPPEGSESSDEKCDLFSGEWVSNPEGPYYTNATCYAIQEHQNCMRSGRPDVGYLKWRWKPDECELPIFDPLQFLELVRGKSLAFVGDSVARNHMQSLICLLASKAGYPVDISTDRIQNKHYQYPAYDFNVSMFWSPFLVRTAETNLEKPPFTVHLDQFHPNWTAQIASFDYVIISAGHWFTRPTYLYLNNSLIGCVYCAEPNITHLLPPFSCRWAFRTAFRAINSAPGFDGVAFVRTFAPSHFEGGAWDNGGKCARTSPFKRNEAVVEGSDLEMYLAQVEELGIAQKAERKNGGNLKVLDVTKIMLMRPDGHPNKYSHLAGTVQSLANDCVHWCLPGPIDSWNDILQELLRRETRNKNR